ncbi:MAG: protoheme IX farnesyltransferase, partial [Planctomycetaceae bacterium]|nr:protoheme IX farnesyltransferase [Planctomycetaceae bacterium]
MSVASSAPEKVHSGNRTGAVAVVSESILRRLADYAELCRPKIALMTLVSVCVGFTLASPVVFSGATLAAAMFGVTLLVAASSILNQCLEHSTDAGMPRTASRPLPSGRLTLTECCLLATGLTFIGTVVLWQYVNPLTAAATFLTLLTYVFAYTVLKTRTSLCTTVGAVPGAMPPVLGWLAAGGQIGPEALALFALFFVWQFPHFLAIGWIYRREYHSAGLRMLPSFTDRGLRTGVIAVIYAAAFVPVSAMPAYVGLSGDLSAAAAL